MHFPMPLIGFLIRTTRAMPLYHYALDSPIEYALNLVNNSFPFIINKPLHLIYLGVRIVFWLKNFEKSVDGHHATLCTRAHPA
jgi:hypothetical protein